jgi:RNA recognition motif-containing protein
LQESDGNANDARMKIKPNATVYISNLSYERDRDGLKILFKRYGAIKFIKIIVDPKTNVSMGMAFVEMGSIDEATKAIDGLDGAVIDGRTIKANYAKPQTEDSAKKKFFPAPVKKDKKLSYKDTQLAKKARNDKKREAKKLPSFKKKA